MVALVVACVAVPAGAADTPTYTNARIVRLEANTRLAVVRFTDGSVQTLELDDNVAGFGDVRAGDSVILSVRREPGHDRIRSIVRATPPSKLARKPTVVVSDDDLAANAPGARREFAAQVASLAEQADRVDRLWDQFVSSCDASVDGDTAGSRAWFGLWDDRVTSDLSAGFCRDLYNQIIGQGEPIKRGMSVAEQTALRYLEPGEVRSVRRQHSMDWNGWDRPAPERQDGV
jgi:hypothetical protein